jgi:Spy/CpxP family protein refolding chaperone
MSLTAEERDAVVSELKRIGATLNLSDEQKQKVQAFMTQASEKVKEYKEQNPSATPQDLVKKVQDNRAALRQRLVDFLSPEQLNRWDMEVAKAKEFLGQKLAA